MNPKYSIIVPAYNSAGFIQKCLDSIEGQIFDRSQYELIIVCDACEDDTFKVALQYADRILNTEFGNDGGSRQAGIDAATAPWILFLDDDDWFLHEYALSMIDKALTEDIDILCYGFIFKGRGYEPPIRNMNGQNIFWPSVWNKVYRHSFIDGIPFRSFQPSPDGNAPDIDWTSRLLEKEFHFAALDHALYYYNYMRVGSQTYNLEVNK